MTTINENIRKIRKDKNLSQKAAAAGIGIAERLYQYYEAGGKKPSADTLIAIADYFDVSVDYLLGRTDNPNSHKL